ncbi:MAG: hypothetical protein ACLFQM_04450 [Fidelibacterota bacterium]
MNSLIMNRLNELWTSGEFISYRHYLRKKRDHNPFVSANIVSVLEKCTVINSRLSRNIEQTKQHLKNYQIAHQTYMWPLHNSSSRIGNALLLNKFKFLHLSPDADCSCMQQIILQENENIYKIIQDLTFYRNDDINFRLPKFQQDLPATGNTFLTWFPPREICNIKKMESIDIVVQANILWFLGKYKGLKIPGANATINYIKTILKRDLLMKFPFKISPYYPYPIAILYYISRAIHWGDIESMQTCKTDIINLTRNLQPKTTLDHLYLAAIGKFWQDEEMVEVHLDFIQKKGLNAADPLFVAPFILPAVQDLPFINGIAKKPLSLINFSSEAFQLALLLWLHQK